MKNIIVNGIEYQEVCNNECDYYMVRTYSAGVFAGKIKERNGMEATLDDARRIWHWEGAATLSELASKGTSLPESCKFPAPVDDLTLTEVIEIIKMTKQAKNSIYNVKIWSNHD